MNSNKLIQTIGCFLVSLNLGVASHNRTISFDDLTDRNTTTITNLIDNDSSAQGVNQDDYRTTRFIKKSNTSKKPINKKKIKNSRSTHNSQPIPEYPFQNRVEKTKSEEFPEKNTLSRKRKHSLRKKTNSVNQEQMHRALLLAGF